MYTIVYNCIELYRMQCREERERARPGVANYWIRARVVLVLHTANSLPKNICRKIFAGKIRK